MKQVCSSGVLLHYYTPLLHTCFILMFIMMLMMFIMFILMLQSPRFVQVFEVW